jgi:hypothetical protein
VEQAVVEHEEEQVGIVQQPRFFFFCRRRYDNRCLLLLLFELSPFYNRLRRRGCHIFFLRPCAFSLSFEHCQCFATGVEM